MQAIAAKSGEQATLPHLLTVAWLTRIAFHREVWPAGQLRHTASQPEVVDVFGYGRAGATTWVQYG